MIGIVATFNAKPGSAAELHELMLEVREMVRANEPGNSLYEVFRSRNDPDAVVVLELYDSEDAFKAHQQGEHLKDVQVRVGQFLTGRPDLHFLDNKS